MVKKPTYEELKRRVKELESEAALRKRAEEALRENEERFRAFMDNNPAAIYIKDKAGQHTYGNKTLLTFFGKKLEEFIGTTSADFFPRDIAKRLEADDQIVRTKKMVVETDEWSETYDGETRWWGETKFPVPASDGRTLVGGVAVNITARKRAEESLKQRLQFQTLLTQISVQFATLAPDKIEGAIEGGLAEIGKHLDIGRIALIQFSEDVTVFQITHRYAHRPEHRPPLFIVSDRLPWFTNSLREGKTLRISSINDMPAEARAEKEYMQQQGFKAFVTIPMKIGESIIGAISYSDMRNERQWPDHLVDQLGVISQLFADALLRKRAEEVLQESENRYRVLVEASPTAILAMRDGRFVFSNPAGARLLGYAQPEDLIGISAMDVVAPASRQTVFDRITRLEQGKANPEVELQLLRPDGSVVICQSTSVAIRLSDGPAAVIIAQDVTNRKQAEEEARRHREALFHVDRVATIGELTASLAHELNQPLSAIVSNAQAAQRFLATDPPNLDEFRDILSDIVNDGNRAGKVIGRLRAFLKKAATDHHPLDINEAIRDVMALVQSDAVLKNVSIATEFAANLPPVLGDQIQLQQVILNLISNSTDAMMNVDADARRLIIRTEKHDQQTVKVAVRDFGVGLDEENINRVFEPFTTTKSDGLGMGLSISRTIIETHGGRLWATNNPDRGATFSFTLPACENKK